MPNAELDGGMVGMTNGAPDENTHVTAALREREVFGGGVPTEQGCVLGLGEAVGEAVVDPDGFATGTEKELGGVGLAGTTTNERFVGENEFGIGGERGFGEEEPLALADETGVAAAVAVFELHTSTGLGFLDEAGFQRFHGGADGRDGAVGDGSHKPLAFVMTTEELLFLVGKAGAETGLAHHQQKVSGIFLDVHNFHGEGRPRSLGHFEEFPLIILPDVQGEVPGEETIAGRDQFDPSSHLGKRFLQFHVVLAPSLT